MVSKFVYGFCIKIYERVSSFSDFNKNFRDFFPVTFSLFNFFSLKRQLTIISNEISLLWGPALAIKLYAKR